MTCRTCGLASAWQPSMTRSLLSRSRKILVEWAIAIDRDRVVSMAAGVAFYVTLALFPTLSVLVSLYGLFFDPGDVRGQMEALTFLPREVRGILDDQMLALTRAEKPTLGFGLLASVTFALWAASGGMHALMDAITMAYCDKETRSWVRVRALSLGAMLLLLLVAVVGVAALAGVPVMLARMGFDAGAEIVEFLRWPGLALGVMGAIGALYRLAPCRTSPALRRIVSPGSIFATLGWLVATAGFSLYVTNFGNYNGTYGALGGVMVLLTWLWITSLMILSGAELDALLEKHRTERDLQKSGPSSADDQASKKETRTPLPSALPVFTSPGSPSPR
jgi:membrane protein